MQRDNPPHQTDRSSRPYTLVPHLPLMRCCAGSVRVVQLQPGGPVLDHHAGYTASTRQHELDHTDHTDHTDQEYICPEKSRSTSRNRLSVRGVQSSNRCALTLRRILRGLVIRHDTCYCFCRFPWVPKAVLTKVTYLGLISSP